MRLPFRSVFVLRPAIVIPLHGITSRTRSYRLFYALSRPLLPLLRRLFPRCVTTTEQIGRAMLRLVRHGHSQPVLEAADISMMGTVTQVFNESGS